MNLQKKLDMEKAVNTTRYNTEDRALVARYIYSKAKSMTGKAK